MSAPPMKKSGCRHPPWQRQPGLACNPRSNHAKVRSNSAEELARRVQDGFVPLVRQIQGFRGYYLLDGGPDVLIAVSMFDSADEALASNETAANWVRNNILEFTRGMPEVMMGNVLVAEVSGSDQ